MFGLRGEESSSRVVIFDSREKKIGGKENSPHTGHVG